MEDQTIKQPKKLSLAELKATSYKDNFDQIVSDLKTAFMMDFQVIEACHHAHISPDTYYRWLELSDEFSEEMDIARSELFRVAKRNWSNAITDGNVDASQKLLEKRQKDLYANRNELTGPNGNDINMGVSELKQIAENTSKLLDETTNESTGIETTSSEGNN